MTAAWSLDITTRDNTDLYTFRSDAVETTIAAGSNGTTLPQATIHVADSSAFPDAGTLIIHSSFVDYTGNTGTAFTGCTGGLAGLLTGDPVAEQVGPILEFEGQDTGNDIGVAHLTLPCEHPVNDFMAEDNLAHLYVREQYVTSYIIKVPQVNPIDPDGERSEHAVYELVHLMAVAEEGIVEPPGGFDIRPAGADRIFDSSDHSRDNSVDFVSVAVLGSVTDAQSNYAVTPYCEGLEYPGSVQVITAPGYGWTDTQPEGSTYYYKDHNFATGGTFRINGTGDNYIEVRANSVTIQPRVQGFGTAFKVPKMRIDGTVRIWARVENIGPGGTQGTQTMALEIVKVGANDVADSLELATDFTWKVCTVPAAPPGFTPGHILIQTLEEEQDLGVMEDVSTSFSYTQDSDGNDWPATFAISTKALTGLEQFWLKELAATIIDIDCHWDFGNITIDAWPKGAHRPASGITLTEGVNLGALVIPAEPHVMNQAAVVWNDGGDLRYADVDVSADTGHPPRRRQLSLGAARTIEQAERDALGQLDLFNRKRQKPTLVHLTNSDTVDGEMPPSYWKWSTMAVSLTSRWLDSGTLDLVAVTFRLNTTTGQLEFIPEASDLILPPEVRPAFALRRMAGGALGGYARTVTPVNPLR